MADTRNSGRIKKYGVCLNEKCEKYKQIQEILHGDFECPECKKKLSPCAPPKKKGNTKLPLIIVGVIAAVAIVAGCIFAFSGDSNEEPEPVVADTIPAIDATEVVAEVMPDTVDVRDTIVQNNTVTTNENVTTKTVVNTTAPAQSKASSNSGSGTLNLGFANYSGATKNGKAHGQGRMTFTSSHVIDSRDTKGRVADAGDYVIGEWNEGKLIQGRWYGSDGNVKGSIIIGM